MRLPLGSQQHWREIIFDESSDIWNVAVYLIFNCSKMLQVYVAIMKSCKNKNSM